MVPLTSLRALGGSLCPAVKPKFCIWRAMAQAALAGCGTWPGPDVQAMLMLPTPGQLLLWLNLSHLGCTAFPLLPYLPKSCLRPSLPLVCLYPRIWPGSGSSGPSAHTFIEWSVTRPPPPQGLPWPPLFSQPAPSTPLGLLWSPQGGVTLSASTSPSPHPEPAVVGLQYHRLGDQLVFKEVHCPVSFLSLSLASVSVPRWRRLCLPKAPVVSEIVPENLCFAIDTPCHVHRFHTLGEEGLYKGWRLGPILSILPTQAWNE